MAATIFLASSRSTLATPAGPPGFDKVVHFSAYGLLATLVLRVLFDPRRPARAWALAVLAASLYGITDEWHQSFTPGRSVDVWDWVADTSGALLAASLYAFWPAWRRRLEHRLAGRRTGAAPRITPERLSSPSPSVAPAGLSAAPAPGAALPSKSTDTE